MLLLTRGAASFLEGSGAAQVAYSDQDNLVRADDAVGQRQGFASLPAPAGRVTLRFLTYARLKQEGAWAQRPELHVVFRPAREVLVAGRLPRVRLEVDFVGLIEKANAVALVDDGTRWEIG
jgi:hypothetical protein